MRKQLLTLDEVLTKKLKDKEFKRYYEEELKNLHLGLKIARLREKHGLTQKELAKRSHTSQSAIARTEKGDYLSYSLRTLGKIAVATGSKLEVSIK